MELKQYYNQVMNGCVHMALATSVEGRPNVRIVTFGYDACEEGRIFFTTFKGNKKVGEFAKNPQVACMPLPQGPETAAQVRIFGEVQKSFRTLEEMIDIIGKKSPEDAQTLKEGGEMLEIYEVCFTEAWVTVGMSEAQRYTIR